MAVHTFDTNGHSRPPPLANPFVAHALSPQCVRSPAYLLGFPCQSFSPILKTWCRPLCAVEASRLLAGLRGWATGKLPDTELRGGTMQQTLRKWRLLPATAIVTVAVAAFIACGKTEPYATSILPIGISAEEAKSIHRLSSYNFGQECPGMDDPHLIAQWMGWRASFKKEHPDLWDDSADLVRPEAPDAAKIWAWDTAMGVHKELCPTAFEETRLELSKGSTLPWWGKDYVLRGD